MNKHIKACIISLAGSLLGVIPVAFIGMILLSIIPHCIIHELINQANGFIIWWICYTIAYIIGHFGLLQTNLDEI